MVRGFQGSHTGIKNLAYFLVFHVLIIFHVEDEALFLWQGLNGLLKHDVGFITVKPLVAFEGFCDIGFGIIQGKVLFAFVDESDALLGYAFFSNCPGSKVVLLDYETNCNIEDIMELKKIIID